jgi:preprotein translocase subunit SecF
MFGVVLVGTYTSVFIASPILIYLGVGSGRTEHVETPAPPEKTPEPAKPAQQRPAKARP